MRQLKEIQTFASNRALFILISVLFTCVLIGITIPFVMDKPADQEAIVGLSIAVLVIFGSFFLLLKMKFELTLKPDRLSFRFRPFNASTKEYKIDELASWSVENHKWYHGFGYKTRLNGGQVYVMSPGKVLAITTKDGRKYRFGINQPEKVKRFITSNWEVNKNMYG